MFEILKSPTEIKSFEGLLKIWKRRPSVLCEKKIVQQIPGLHQVSFSNNYFPVRSKKSFKNLNLLHSILNDDTTQLALNSVDENLFPTNPTQKIIILWN
jgi:hypothetical protein